MVVEVNTRNGFDYDYTQLYLVNSSIKKYIY
jgi:hypothetical protein